NVGAVFCGVFPLRSNRTPAKKLPIEFVGAAPGDNSAPGVLLNWSRPKLELVNGLAVSMNGPVPKYRPSTVIRPPTTLIAPKLAITDPGKISAAGLLVPAILIVPSALFVTIELVTAIASVPDGILRDPSFNSTVLFNATAPLM